MAEDTKGRQIQFLENCYLPQKGIPTDLLDLEALVDAQLTLKENIEENIKPYANMLSEKAEWSDWGEERVQHELEKYEHLRQDALERWRESSEQSQAY